MFVVFNVGMNLLDILVINLMFGIINVLIIIGFNYKIFMLYLSKLIIN